MNTVTYNLAKNYTYVDLASSPHWPSSVVDWLTQYPIQGSYCFGGMGVYFDNEKDAALCILKWSS